MIKAIDWFLLYNAYDYCLALFTFIISYCYAVIYYKTVSIQMKQVHDVVFLFLPA